VAKLVIFQALAVNAGSALTPIGNPQNIFLWQYSEAAFSGFVLAMLPVVAVMMAGLMLLTFVAFRSRPLAVDPRNRRALERPLLAVSLALYIPFLLLAGAALSQFVSNVQAAIVLAEYSADWRTIAWGVSVGGFGTAIASLANVIALRMLGERRAWWTFHL